MIPELGQFSLVLATVLALILGVLPLWGTVRHNPTLQALARPLALLQFVLVALSFACLAYAFLNNDFSATYLT